MRSSFLRNLVFGFLLLALIWIFWNQRNGDLPLIDEEEIKTMVEEVSREADILTKSRKETSKNLFDAINNFAEPILENYLLYTQYIDPQDGPFPSQTIGPSLIPLPEGWEQTAQDLQQNPDSQLLIRLYGESMANVCVLLEEAFEYYEEGHFIKDTSSRGQILHYPLMRDYRQFILMDSLVRLALSKAYSYSDCPEKNKFSTRNDICRVESKAQFILSYISKDSVSLGDTAILSKSLRELQLRIDKAISHIDQSKSRQKKNYASQALHYYEQAILFKKASDEWLERIKNGDSNFREDWKETDPQFRRHQIGSPFKAMHIYHKMVDAYSAIKFDKPTQTVFKPTLFYQVSQKLREQVGQ